MAIKVGDKVIVIAGSNKGKEGKITKVLMTKLLFFGFKCFLHTLTPSTTTFPFFTSITLPSLSLSFPAITLTVSPFLIFNVATVHLL